MSTSDKRNISIKVKNLFDLVALIQRDIVSESNSDLHAAGPDMADKIENEGALIMNQRRLK